jgi:hypothetical protein
MKPDQYGVERAVHRERRDRAAGEGRRAQQRQVEHGMRDAPLGHDEGGQRRDPDSQADDDPVSEKLSSPARISP